MAEISVVMSVYNEKREYLIQSIESILNQTFRDFEYLIVLDNPQNLNAKALLEKYQSDDSRIKLIFNESNLGLAASLNKALTVANGPYIARMDADDIAEPNRFLLQRQYLLDHKLNLVGCATRTISDNGVVIRKNAYISYSPQLISKILRCYDCIPHPSWFLEKNVYIQLHGYREIYACEDYDFLLRAISNGIKIGICSEILMNYRLTSKSISRKNALVQSLTANYLQKNYKRIQLVSIAEIDNYLRNTINDEKLIKHQKALELISSNQTSKLHVIKNCFAALILSPYVYYEFKKSAIRKFFRLFYSFSSDCSNSGNEQ